MPTTTTFIQDTFAIGGIAAATTTTAASLCGHIEQGEPIAPLNAISHILWGDRAADHDEASAKYTMPGVALNAAAVTGWAGIHELLFAGRRPKNLASALSSGAAISALAYVTDYYIVPNRVTPGFEKRLSNKSLAVVYVTLAASLGVGSWMRHQRS